jgi:hypothetical protein
MPGASPGSAERGTRGKSFSESPLDDRKTVAGLSARRFTILLQAEFPTTANDAASIGVFFD